jgi:hypothetical protein
MDTFVAPESHQTRAAPGVQSNFEPGPSFFYLVYQKSLRTTAVFKIEVKMQKFVQIHPTPLGEVPSFYQRHAESCCARLATSTTA